jgi:hypothetical protein
MVKNTSVLHEHPKTSAVITLISLVFFIFVFVLFAYTFLHESGHAITGFLFGQKLTEFDVNFLNLGAHVGMIGNLTPAQITVQSVSGEGLPLLIWFVFISLVPRKASFSLEVLKLFSSMIVLNTLLAWIIIPILYLFGNAPSDDVTTFLRYSQMPPLLLTIMTLVLYVWGWSYFLSKIDSMQNVFLLFHITNLKTLAMGTRRTIPVMVGTLALFILLTSMLNASAEKNSIHAASQDFVPIAEIDLSAQSYSSETLAQFELKEPANVGVFVIVRGIETTYFDLSVMGFDGYSSTVLHGEVYRAHQESGSWKETLPAGTYRVVLTSHQSPGTVSVFLKTP